MVSDDTRVLKVHRRGGGLSRPNPARYLGADGLALGNDDGRSDAEVRRGTEDAVVSVTLSLWIFGTDFADYDFK